ncbi:GntR family transcriptional regulator [Limnochorda pilosa]|uniref:GntR family transcriptional regulator n=1 Tax=Limnochorda pilosa TaxID=1555112 RepID=A0A0K2SHQ7_LIMPI|nr:GntR family transcriptional regulator [Limnochorda pilosa]BAS26369.1 GntR family transcriptional regulator [Limnochorda pilosa]
MEEIRRDAPVPLYYQLYDILLRRITDGTYAPGDQIPTELELSRRYQVSRVTVKQAIQRLATEGHLYRVQGKGTFVAKPRIPRWLKQVQSFIEEMSAKGMVVETVALDVGLHPCDRQVAEALKLEVGEPVNRIKRLRKVDGDPVALQTSYVPDRLCPGLAQLPEIRSGSLYAAMERNYGRRPVHAYETYEVKVATDPERVKLLDIEPGAPYLAVTRISHLENGTPVEWATSSLRGDRYKLEVELGAELS